MTQQTRMVLAGAAATALSATTLLTVFTDYDWLLPALLALAVAVGGCEAARQLGFPRPLVPLVALAALLLVLMVEFAAAEAWYLVIPNGAVVSRIGDLVAQARHDIRALSAPVEASPGTALLASGGIGLVAIVVDTLAVTYRRPALTGFALVSLFVVPAGVAPDGVNWITFVLGAAGYLVILLTDAQAKVNRWGRSLDRSRRRSGSSPVSVAGRRVGVATIGAAVLVPVLLPGLDNGLVTGSGGHFGRGHSHKGSVLVNNPIIALDQDLNRPDAVEVINYRTDQDPSYLRLVSLDDFTGSVWAPRKLQVPRSQQVEIGLGDPVGLTNSKVATDQVRFDIDVEQLDSKWLPLPYPTGKVTGIGDSWVYERNTFNVYPLKGNQSIKGKSYTAFARAVEPTAAQLRSAPQPIGLDSRFTNLPKDMPAIIGAEARRVTAGKKTAYDKAVALQDWLRGSQFVYNTKAPNGTGFDNIAQFLRTHEGFCVHFASTMAVMARYLGIPARVAVGYTAGTPDSTGQYNISSNDAHSWPELYFQGAGWMAFEPTPSARVGASPPAYARQAVTTAPNIPTAAAGAGASPSSTGGQRPDQEVGGGVVSDSGGGVLSGVNWLLVIVVIGVLGVAASPATVRASTRRRRWRRATSPVAVADAAWQELHDLVIDYGLDLPESLTPRQYASRLSDAAWFQPDARSAVATVARAAERSQYARDVGEVGDLRAEVARVETGLVRSTSRIGRLRARAFPASTLTWRHDVGERAAAGMDRLDHRVTGWSSRLLPWRGRR